MKILRNIGISVISTLLILFVLYNFIPLGVLKYFEIESENLGATVTSIQSTDTVREALLTITNTNITNLNADKFELTDWYATTSATQLVEVGTLTAGTWNSSIIGAAYGGTGSSTLSQFSVLLGSTTNPIGMVSGLGTSGQSLVSNGVGLSPTWQSVGVNQGDDYTWTGYHTFLTAFFTEASSTVATTTDLNITGTLDFTGTSVTGIANTASSTTWTSSGTYTKSTGATKVLVQAWGAGASGAKGGSSGGGGGGGLYIEYIYEAGDLGATETITIGTGGIAVTSNAVGNAGGDTTFGSLLTADGGGGGQRAGSGVTNGGNGGNRFGGVVGIMGLGTPGDGGGINSGGGGGVNAGNGGLNGGNSEFGGGGGGGAGSGFGAAGGISTNSGDGGAASISGNGTAGTVPGGGGGATSSGTSSGAGAGGQIIVTEFF